MPNESATPPDAPVARPSLADAPRWVKVSALVALLLFAAFVVIHLMGGGFGRHMATPQSQPQASANPWE